MPLDLWFGDVGHEMVLELAGRFEVAAAAMAALPGIDVVFDEDRTRRRVGSSNARVLPVLPAAAVRGGWVLRLARAASALAALQDPLEFLLHLAQTASQVGVFRLQRGNAIQKLLLIIHAGRILVKGDTAGKRRDSTSNFARPPRRSGGVR
jgi:hypothetical protein